METVSSARATALDRDGRYDTFTFGRVKVAPAPMR